MKARILEPNCAVRDLLVLAGDTPGSAKVVSAALPDFTSAERKAKQHAQANPNTNVYVVQVQAQFRAVPHVYEVHPNEAPAPALPAV
jgi:hypothetical protein